MRRLLLLRGMSHFLSGRNVVTSSMAAKREEVVPLLLPRLLLACRLLLRNLLVMAPVVGEVRQQESRAREGKGAEEGALV